MVDRACVLSVSLERVRLTRLRGRGALIAVSTVGALLMVALLTGFGILPGGGSVDPATGGQAGALADVSRAPSDVVNPGGAPTSAAPDQPSSPAPNGIDSITDGPLEPVGPGAAPGASAGPGGSAGQIGNPVLEAEVLDLVNQERTAAGCPSVSADGPLTGLARAHSADMRDRNFFAHDNPSGQGPEDRALAAGIGNLGAENIAVGWTTAEAVMRALMDSPTHRAIILKCSLRTLGVGVAYGGSYGIYWTQDFGN